MIMKIGRNSSGTGCCMMLKKPNVNMPPLEIRPAVMPEGFDRQPSSKGRGVGGELETKLQNLKIKTERPKKQNIKFNI